ncbi:MAG: GTP cyclohydrolase II [Myxococcales bacterium]|nr:GTP cyclohydrolase II [Myxococcales bacterium]MCB9748906.1 GTP cyclohydrolase II [Myxococcales bacterium]
MPVPHAIALRFPLSRAEVRVLARAKLPSRHGEFEILSFCDSAGRPLDDVALIRGDVRGAEELDTRVHSECLTGDVFGSYRCDCRAQLELALSRVAGSARGVILYMRQEGRGIGIANKIRAYALQEAGLDTVDANRHLGFDDDMRDYSVAAAMLQAMEVRSVVLHTNNLLKVEGLQNGGVAVARREPIVTPPRAENARYLSTKRDRSGHLL